MVIDFLAAFIIGAGAVLGAVLGAGLGIWILCLIVTWSERK